MDNNADTQEHFSSEIIDSVPTKLHARIDITATDNKPVATHKSDTNLSDDERNVYYILGLEPTHVDSIAEKSGLPIHKVTRILSSLEMNGYVQNLGSRNYSIK